MTLEVTSPAAPSGLHNEVELWFAKIERDVVSRGVFTSVKDLARKLMRYIRQYHKAPKDRELEILSIPRVESRINCYSPLVPG